MSDAITIQDPPKSLPPGTARFIIAALPHGFALAANAFGALDKDARESVDQTLWWLSILSPAARRAHNLPAGGVQMLAEHCIWYFGVGAHFGADPPDPDAQHGGGRRRGAQLKYAAAPQDVEHGETMHADATLVSPLLERLRREGGKAVPVDVASFLYAEVQEFKDAWSAGRVNVSEMRRYMKELGSMRELNSQRQRSGPSEIRSGLPDLKLQA